MEELVEIQSRTYWFKVVEMLQQNWAIIDPSPSDACEVFFISDTAGVFDEMEFSSEDKAITALKRNGFSKYADDKDAQKFIRPPESPFYRREHPNGPIYSSGRFWE